MKTKHRIQAILDDDLAELLQTAGLIRPLREGKLKCCSCGGTITEHSLQAIIPRGKTFAVLCSKPACLLKAVQE